MSMRTALRTMLLCCGPLPACAASVSTAPPRNPDAGQVARCSVRASQERPLVTEWPATERSRLESRAANGLIVVSYSGCEMRVLDRCQAKGHYRFTRTSLATDGFTVSNEDELYARLPLGAATLEGALKRAGALTLSYAVVGQYDADDFDPSKAELSGDCARASHVISGYAVGAFKMSTGASGETGGGASVLGVGAGAVHKTSQNVLRAGGDPDACTTKSAAAPEHCSTPIQLFLAALPSASGGSDHPGTAQGTSSAGSPVREAPGSDKPPADGARDALPSTRFLMYAMGGAVGAGQLKLDDPFVGGTSKFDGKVGPSVSGWIGLRYALERNVDFQARVGMGFAWLPSTYERYGGKSTSLRLITPSGEVTFRWRPGAGAFYAGAGLGGHILLATAEVTTSPDDIAVLATDAHTKTTTGTFLFGHGLADAGMLLGDRQQWDVGIRAGGGTTITFDVPLQFWATLGVGRTLD